MLSLPTFFSVLRFPTKQSRPLLRYWSWKTTSPICWKNIQEKQFWTKQSPGSKFSTELLIRFQHKVIISSPKQWSWWLVMVLVVNVCIKDQLIPGEFSSSAPGQSQHTRHGTQWWWEHGRGSLATIYFAYPAESPLQSSSSYYQLLRVDCSTAAFVSWRRSRAVMGSVIVININPRAQLSYEHPDPQSDVSKAQSRLI